MKNNWKLYIEHVKNQTFLMKNQNDLQLIKVSKPAIAYFKHINF